PGAGNNRRETLWLLLLFRGGATENAVDLIPFELNTGDTVLDNGAFELGIGDAFPGRPEAGKDQVVAQKGNDHPHEHSAIEWLGFVRLPGCARWLGWAVRLWSGDLLTLSHYHHQQTGIFAVAGLEVLTSTRDLAQPFDLHQFRGNPPPSPGGKGPYRMSRSTVQVINRCHSTPSVSCSQCRLASICMPISLHVDDMDKVDSIIQRGRPLQKGDYLFRAQDEFHAVYAVRAGTVKTLTTTTDGREQITGCYLPGEIFGLDGVATCIHTNSAIALEASAICEIPFERLDSLGAQIPDLHRHMFRLMGREIGVEHQLITLLSKSNAEERVATLLLSISERNGRRNLSPV